MLMTIRWQNLQKQEKLNIDTASHLEEKIYTRHLSWYSSYFPKIVLKRQSSLQDMHMCARVFCRIEDSHFAIVHAFLTLWRTSVLASAADCFAQDLAIASTRSSYSSSS